MSSAQAAGNLSARQADSTYEGIGLKYTQLTRYEVHGVISKRLYDGIPQGNWNHVGRASHGQRLDSAQAFETSQRSS